MNINAQFNNINEAIIQLKIILFISISLALGDGFGYLLFSLVLNDGGDTENLFLSSKED